MGAITDTDILIHLAMVNRLDILEYLFKEIIIPQFVFDVEIKKKAGKYYGIINQAISKKESIFKILNRKEDKAINLLAKDTIEDKKKVIESGESECAGYAIALRIPIIISDNYTEFRWLDEFITLTYKNILALCVYFKNIEPEEAQSIYNQINSKLEHPSSNTFREQYNKSMSNFKEKKWDKYLGVDFNGSH